MELIRLKEQVEDLYDSYRKVWFTSGLIFLSGIIIAIIGLVVPGDHGKMISVIGTSICVGVIVGVVAGLTLGRPLGWIFGLLLGLFIGVYIGYTIGDALGAFTSSYISPTAGIVMGWWTGKKKGY